MPYLYASEREDYSDLASGRVFYSLPGHPAFPVRLVSEIFQRCLALWRAGGGSGRCILYDPCCGAGYQLSVLAYLHWNEIRSVTGSDVDAQAAALAARNLGLLGCAGLDRRIAEIEQMQRSYGKPSHAEALASALRMRERIASLSQSLPIAARAFQADAWDGAGLAQGLNGAQADLIITDVPYGQHSQWAGAGEQAAPSNPIEALLAALRGVLAPGGVLALSTDKQPKFNWPAYRRVAHFQVGKRKTAILQLEEA
jgi:23S rRNA (guanine2535-N1)-methyltransferase